MPNKENNRYDNLDLIKALAIMAVVSLHVPLWEVDFINGTSHEVFQYAFRIISEGVPFFVTINGFLLFKKEQLDLQALLKKTLRICVLLVLWGVILAGVGTLLSAMTGNTELNTITYYILNTKVGAEYTGVLWFLQKLVAVYLIFPGLYYLYKYNYEIFKKLFYVLVIFVPGIATMILVRDFIEAITGRQHEYISMLISYINECNPVGNGWYVFYFCLGGVLWHELDRFKLYKKYLLIAGVLAWPLAFFFGYTVSKFSGVTYNQAFNYGSPFIIMTLIGLIYGTLSYENEGRPLQRLFASIGKNTFGIYLSHFLFIFIINAMWPRQSFRERLLAYIFVLMGGYIFSVIIGRIPYVNKIIKI